MTPSSEKIIEQTNNWIKSVVIDCNFCPFAAKAVMKKSIHYVVKSNITTAECLTALLTELQFLDEEHEFETSFIIFENNFPDFDSYLDIVKKAEKLLSKNNYEGIYQIASFHPDYCFAGADEEDAANYTNRSIYPMLHILREESLTKALSVYPHPELIPENNIAYAREKGIKYMQVLRAACF